MDEQQPPAEREPDSYNRTLNHTGETLVACL
jgi:hypothetical protein